MTLSDTIDSSNYQRGDEQVRYILKRARVQPLGESGTTRGSEAEIHPMMTNR